jgi:FHA domain-containing protein
VFAAFEPPRVGPIAASPPPREVAQSLDARLWQAFCEGAGVRIDLPNDPALAAARMHQVGRLLSAAVAGTRELMVVRASTKYELRAEVTQIQARGNNPLKFAPDLRTGVEQLVQPATRGFLEGPAAMEDAMRDLVGHSIGSVAGMRAALEGLLDRFDPAALEETLGAGSVLDSLVPLSRRAKLWELYRQRFRDLRDEAQENFHALFGKAFVAAYEQQVDQLRKSAQVGSSPSAGEK